MRRKVSTGQQTLTNRTGRKTKNQQLRYQGWVSHKLKMRDQCLEELSSRIPSCRWGGMWVTSSVILLNHGRERRKSHSFSETVTSCLAPDQPIFFSQSFIMSCIVFKFCFLFWFLFWFHRKWPAFTSHQVCHNTHTQIQNTHTHARTRSRAHTTMLFRVLLAFCLA